jgi:hypothetical protein
MRRLSPADAEYFNQMARRGGLFIGRSTFESPGLSASQAAVSALQTPARNTVPRMQPEPKLRCH